MVPVSSGFRLGGLQSNAVRDCICCDLLKGFASERACEMFWGDFLGKMPEQGIFEGLHWWPQIYQGKVC